MIGTPRPWLHDELVHVPLVMRLPGGAEAGLRIGALTQPVDLPATFAVTLLPGSDAVPPTNGHNLWPLIRGEVEEIRRHAIAGIRVGERENWLLRSTDWAFHLPVGQPEDEPPRKPQLFAKPEDRWEVNDLSQQQMELCEAMEKALREEAKPLSVR